MIKQERDCQNVIGTTQIPPRNLQLPTLPVGIQPHFLGQSSKKVFYKKVSTYFYKIYSKCLVYSHVSLILKQSGASFRLNQLTTQYLLLTNYVVPLTTNIYYLRKRKFKLFASVVIKINLQYNILAIIIIQYTSSCSLLHLQFTTWSENILQTAEKRCYLLLTFQYLVKILNRLCKKSEVRQLHIIMTKCQGK